MNTRVQLAGQLTNLGNAWITTLANWADMALPTVLSLIVVVTVARKMSLRAGVGALIMLVIALGIYQSRFSLSGIFKDEVDHPGSSGLTPVVRVVDGPHDQLSSGGTA
jgi:hypothetical protein